MTTVARIHTSKDASWYTTSGQPLYEIPKADGKGVRAPTLADAKKRGDLIPRVTTILRQLAKPELQDWLIEQAVLAVMTTPQLDGEATDAFIHRVLHVERIQDQESSIARDKGTEIHAALETYFGGKDVAPDLLPWIEPAAKVIAARGQRIASEKILVGDGYAGRTDLIQEAPDAWWIWDFKTTKKLPEKGSWSEHVLQLSAYAAAWLKQIDKGGVLPPEMTQKPIRTANAYISTVEQGKFVIWDNDPDWQSDYNEAFAPLVRVWRRLNRYTAQQ